jgi:hypothetical protein
MPKRPKVDEQMELQLSGAASAATSVTHDTSHHDGMRGMTRHTTEKTAREPMQQIAMWLPRSALAEIDAMVEEAADRDVTRSRLLRTAIQDWIASRRGRTAKR